MVDLNTVSRSEEGDYARIGQVYETMVASGESTNFSADNRKWMKEYLGKVKNCKAILEIGVENNVDKSLSSTRVILDNKDDSTIFIGVDLESRSHLDSTEKNIYTIQTSSSNIQQVMDFARSKGVTEFDFIHIDGWHSIDQCIIEFDGYTPFLSKDGIVAFHDTNHHWGPMWLVEKTDRSVWEVVNHPGDVERDFGIGFAWRK